MVFCKAPTRCSACSTPLGMSSAPFTSPCMPPHRAHRYGRPPRFARARPPCRPRHHACPSIAHVAVRALHLVYTPAHVLRIPHLAAYLPRGVHGAEHVPHIVHKGVHV
ncbi:hypothetical protein B0H14DRAFT_3452411 [Mycena olivaceomarginata]|nr:hypothetical protein B0H14DRAFT_3452411 [Mycena olivaceomarginata]